MQLYIYALAAMKHFKNQHKVNKVTVHIGQPRINNFDSFSVPLKDLKKMKKKVIKAGKIALSGEGKCVYDSKHCFFCSAKYTCDAYAEATSGFVDTTI